MSVLSEILLRTIPEAAQAGLSNGELAVFGSVIRSTQTGQIAYHLQETGALTRMAATFLTPGGAQLEAAKFASQLIGDAALYRQGQQIKAAVELLSKQQLANLLVSGATLGVSVVGFAVLGKQISNIERRISSLDERLAGITRSIEDLRQQRIAEDLTLLRTLVEQMDESWSLRSSFSQRERVAAECHILANRFHQRAMLVLKNESGGLVASSPLLDAFEVAQSTRVAARLACDEHEAAIRSAEEASRQYSAIIEGADPVSDSLTMLKDETLVGIGAWGDHQQRKFELPYEVSHALRARAEASEATSDLISFLGSAKISGTEWIKAVRNEQERPILIVQRLRA